MIPQLERALKIAVVVAGAIALLGALVLAALHVSTLYAVNQTSGAWLSFAYYAREGVLYPPLMQDGYYAGTRYFPGFFSLHAAFAAVTGEFLVSGKLLTYLSTAGIVAGLTAAINAKVKNLPLALAFAATFVATFIGHKASMTIRGDVLPLAISILVLVLFEDALVKEKLSWQRLLLLAALAALPPLAKFTSFHALTACTLYLFFRDKKKSIVFGASGFAFFALGVVLTNVISSGRFFDSLAAAAMTPPSHKREGWEALMAYWDFLRWDRPFLLLFPFALLSVGMTGKSMSLWKIFFLLQLVISVGFFFDTGAEYNHLVDLLAATLVLAAEHTVSVRPPLRLAALGAFLVALLVGMWLNYPGAWRAPERGMNVQSYFADSLGLGNGSLLAHDPTVAVLSGRRPVVADDFQYRVLVWLDKVDKEELPRRIEARAFDHIVLLNPEAPPAEDPSFHDVELGELPARAIRENYVLERQVDRFYVYKPR